MCDIGTSEDFVPKLEWMGNTRAYDEMDSRCIESKNNIDAISKKKKKRWDDEKVSFSFKKCLLVVDKWNYVIGYISYDTK